MHFFINLLDLGLISVFTIYNEIHILGTKSKPLKPMSCLSNVLCQIVERYCKSFDYKTRWILGISRVLRAPTYVNMQACRYTNTYSDSSWLPWNVTRKLKCWCWLVVIVLVVVWRFESPSKLLSRLYLSKQLVRVIL